MKKTIYYFFFLTNSLLAQNPFLEYTLKSPDVSTLMEIKNLDLNEAQGKPIISIPLYSIDIDGINIPVTVSYNSEGTKVEYESSWIGNSWGLNSGGVISRKVIGRADEHEDYAWAAYAGYDPSTGVNDYPPCMVLSLYEDKGWFDNSDDRLALANYFKSNNGDLAGLDYDLTTLYLTDYSPDIFSYILPNGKSGSFLFKNNNTIVNNGKEMISYKLNEQGIISSFKIIDEFGNQFIYNEYSLTGYNLRETKTQYTNGLLKKPAYYPFFTYPTVPCSEGSINDLYSGSDEGSNEVFKKPHSDSFYLTKVITTNGQEINFTYSEVQHANVMNTRNSIDPFRSRSFLSVGNHDSYNGYNYLTTKQINSIKWDLGEIIFNTNNEKRKDIKAESELKALDNIIINNHKGDLVKKISFRTSYNEAKNIDEIEEKYKYIFRRLWLNSIVINDFSSSALEYKFNYNDEQLPARLSFEQDYWGYYNNNGADNDDKVFLPNLWFYPEDKRSYTRQTAFSIFRRSNFEGSEITLNDSNEFFGYEFADLNPNKHYTIAGKLINITYPTGGKIDIEYEPNSFKVEDKVIEGGGVRVKKIISETPEGNKEIDEYFYNDEDGFSSGRVTSLPKFGNLIYLDLNGNKKYSLKSTISGGKVYYGRVEKKRIGGGKVVSKYLIPFDIETDKSLYSEFHEKYFYEKNFDISSFGVISQAKTAEYNNRTTSEVNPYDYGLAPTSRNFSNLFGKLEQRIVFDENDNILLDESLKYNFTYKSENIYTLTIATNGTKLNTIFMGELELASKTTTSTFQKKRSLITTENFEYNPIGLIYSKSNKIGEDVYQIERIKYPQDLIQDGNDKDGIMAKLKGLHRVGEPIEVSTHLIDMNGIEKKLSTEKTVFKEENNLILPSVIQTAKANNDLEDRHVYDRYDNYGNLLEYHTAGDNSPHTVLLWGYNGKLLIAKIENTTYSDVLNSLSFGTFEFDNDTLSGTAGVIRSIDESYLSQIDDLRIKNPSWMITTYRHKPLVGVTQITQPNGISTYYEYDDFNRLKYIKDKDNNLLKEYNYHFVSSNNITSSQLEENEVTAQYYKIRRCTTNLDTYVDVWTRAYPEGSFGSGDRVEGASGVFYVVVDFQSTKPEGALYTVSATHSTSCPRDVNDKQYQ